MSASQVAGTGLAANDRGGLPPLPRLIFLDTNVVQHLLTFGEFVYDHYLSPEAEAKLEALGARITEDVEALAAFMELGRRNGWPLAVSQRTLDELDATPNPMRRHDLLVWGWELAQYFQINAHGHEEDEQERESGRWLYAQQLYLRGALDFLPDEGDRLLLLDAIAFGCDVFLTVDYRSIWRFRDHIRRFGISVMRPAELLEYVEPWAGLLR